MWTYLKWLWQTSGTEGRELTGMSVVSLQGLVCLGFLWGTTLLLPFSPCNFSSLARINVSSQVNHLFESCQLTSPSWLIAWKVHRSGVSRQENNPHAACPCHCSLRSLGFPTEAQVITQKRDLIMLSRNHNEAGSHTQPSSTACGDIYKEKTWVEASLT